MTQTNLIEYGIKHPYTIKKHEGYNMWKKKNTETMESVNMNIVKWDTIGMIIEGLVLKIEDGVNFNNRVYTIKTASGEKTVFGTRVIDDCLKDIKPNTMVRIQYTGEKPMLAGKKPLKIFDIFVDE
jgi:hypothetical protein